MSKMSNVGSTVGRETHRMVGQIEALADTAKEKATEAASGASEFMDQAKEKVQEWASDAAQAATQAKDKAQEYASAAVQKAGDFTEDLKGWIREYPVVSVLAGFGLGFLCAAACGFTAGRSRD